MSANARTVLIPHDGSDLSSRSAETIAPLIPPGTQVIVLHVDDGQSVEEAAIAAAEKALRSKDLTVTRRSVASEDAAQAILDVAAEVQPDLVAMSTHGRSGIARLTRGSVAERVLRHCPVPVLMTNPMTEGGASGIERTGSRDSSCREHPDIRARPSMVMMAAKANVYRATFIRTSSSMQAQTSVPASAAPKTLPCS